MKINEFYRRVKILSVEIDKKPTRKSFYSRCKSEASQPPHLVNVNYLICELISNLRNTEFI